MFKNEDGTYNTNKVITTVLIILNMLGVTGTAIVFDYFVEQSAMRLLNDPMSRLTQTVNKKAEDIAEAKTKKVMYDQAQIMALAEVFNGFRGMDSQELLKYMETKFDFADTMQNILKGINPQDIKNNHQWIAEQRAEMEAASTVSGNNTEEPIGSCGDILVIKDVPALFKDEHGELLKVYSGKPVRSDGRCYVYDVYYVRSSRDQVRVLRTISDVILKEC